MSDSIGFSLDHLPLEILYAIFHFLDIPDILRLRQVSRYLNGVSLSRDIWTDAYRRAQFVRPPGPFLAQSALDLENALVTSFRLNQNVSYCSSRAQSELLALKLREIRYIGAELCIRLIFGRFLLVAFKEEVRCYDLNLDAFDSNSGANIVYRPTGTLRSFHCASAVDAEGRRFACMVLSDATPDLTTQETEITQISIYMLRATEQSELTMDLLHQSEHDAFDIKVVDLGCRVIVVQGRGGPGVDADWRLVALDVHSRTQFFLPSFTHATWEAAEVPDLIAIEEITLPTSISTSTHLLLARSFFTQAAGWNTFLMAFPLPPSSICHNILPSSTPLSPSHRSVIPGISIPDVALLHDAFIHPSTQDILFTIRVAAFEHSRPRYSVSKYGVLRLSAWQKSHNNKLGTITFQAVGPFIKYFRMSFHHPTFNGIGRVFYTYGPGRSEVAVLEYDVRGEGTGYEEPEHKVIERPSILRLSASHELLDYDPYAGRICIQSVPVSKYRVIQVYDLAVGR